MKRKVALIEFSIFDQYPLISGYLHAYALTASEISQHFEFVYYQEEVGRVRYTESLQAIRALGAHIVCFSAYVWNIGLIRRLLRDLQAVPHIEHIVLGGHQISHHIEKYIDRADRNCIVINGQGEIAFRDTLLQLAQSSAMQPLKGVSFYADGQLFDGGEADMLRRLDDLPSPYLNGHFDQMLYSTAIIETNRGCPYQCTFCTWGGDTMRVTKFEIERVKQELLWLAKRSVLFLYLADANWGILPRDVEISEYIARLKSSYGAPWSVYYAATKNKPKGSIACIEKFHEGGVIASQAIGIQSMDPQTLSLVKRENIKTYAFIEMFKQLSTKGIDSYCELIWPLPGETLDSLKQGFEMLLEAGARTIILYPAILINNSKLQEQVTEYGMEYVDGDDWMSELKIVKATKFAGRTDVEDGFWFYYAYFLLCNCDFHKSMLRYLQAATGRGCASLVSEFSNELRANKSSAYAQTILHIFEHEAHGTLLTIGRIASHLGHEQRLSAIADVVRFASRARQGSPSACDIAMLSLWSLSFPRLFADTPHSIDSVLQLLGEFGSPHQAALSDLANVLLTERGVCLIVNDSDGAWREGLKHFGVVTERTVTSINVIPPSTTFVPYDPIDENKNFQYAHGMIERMGRLAPQIQIETTSLHSAGAGDPSPNSCRF